MKKNEEKYRIIDPSDFIINMAYDIDDYIPIRWDKVPSDVIAEIPLSCLENSYAVDNKGELMKVTVINVSKVSRGDDDTLTDYFELEGKKIYYDKGLI